MYAIASHACVSAMTCTVSQQCFFISQVYFDTSEGD
jgi:hypothetical protein